MSEERYEPEDWMELRDLIMCMDEDVEEKDFYEVEGPELDLLKQASDFIKKTLHIQTGDMVTTSPLTGEKYKVNIWVEDYDTGAVTALSKRRIEEE